LTQVPSSHHGRASGIDLEAQMGEKGNAIEAVAPGTTSIVERATTVVTDTTGEVVAKVREEAIGTVAGGAMTAAAGRLRKNKDDDKDDDSEDTSATE
jgi:hypothetical protein